jgi:hypothetical protein
MTIVIALCCQDFFFTFFLLESAPLFSVREALSLTIFIFGPLSGTAAPQQSREKSFFC